MAKKKSGKRRRLNPLKLNPGRLLIFGALVFLSGGGLFTWHHFAPPSTREKIEGVTLDVIDVVRESRVAPNELVFWLDLVADNIPLLQGNVVAPGVVLDNDTHTLGGAPVSSQSLTVLNNTGYLVGYDETCKNPAWVAYKVFPPRYEPSPRPEGFEVDTRTRSRIDTATYARSGYDRGHMAPNRAISLCYGREAQRETFLMSNVAPQVHGLNGAFWEAMERRVIERYTRRYGDVWVICGPVYDPGKTPRKIKNVVVVPDAFFLVIAETDDTGGIRAQAFLIPHRDIKKTANPSQFLVSIRDIETKTGLNFFSKLPSPAQDTLETTPARRAW